MILAMLALATAPDPALVRQEGVVAEAAAAVADARGQGLRSARIAELMAVYRQEAERLAAMEPTVDRAAEARVRAAALRGLSDATARGAGDPNARAIAESWLGPLSARMGVLDTAEATAEAGPPELLAPICADVEAQATAVWITATYDAARADAAAREARTRAAALQASTNPMERGGLDVEVDLRALQLTADVATTTAHDLRVLADRARTLAERARAHLESP